MTSLVGVGVLFSFFSFKWKPKKELQFYFLIWGHMTSRSSRNWIWILRNLSFIIKSKIVRKHAYLWRPICIYKRALESWNNDNSTQNRKRHQALVTVWFRKKSHLTVCLHSTIIFLTLRRPLRQKDKILIKLQVTLKDGRMPESQEQTKNYKTLRFRKNKFHSEHIFLSLWSL